ncbi:MAG: hypothetical protein AB7G93_13390 [Bdellovibrionales bacterium]
MHSLTAIEAYFTYMGVFWYQEVVRFLQSDHFVRSVFLLVFGIMFMTTVVQLFARQMGTNVIGYRYVSLGTLVKVVLCYLLGMAALKVDTKSLIKNYDKDSWENSPYIVSRLGVADKEIRLSLPVDLMIRSSEEVGWFFTKMTDWLMKGPNSETKAPNLFYKAMMLAGATTIGDPKLRSKLELYTVDCIDRLMPTVEAAFGPDNHNLDKLLNFDESYSQELSQISLGGGKTCLDLRQEVQNGLYKTAQPNLPWNERIINSLTGDRDISTDQLNNYMISSALMNFYIEKNEKGLGVVNGGEVPGVYGRILQYLGKLTGHEGIMRTLGLREVAGAGVAVERAKEFNEQLRMAPMILGLSKAGLIVASSLLPFFLVAMRWRIVVWWWLVYTSLCLWAPLWTGLYKLITNVFVVPDMTASFGRMTDSFSMYSAMLISDQAYYISSVISWAQIAVGPGLTGLVGFFAGQWLLSSKEDHVPTAIQQVANTAVIGAKVLG